MSMNIEALVKKHSRAFRGDVRGLRNALTEQAEAFNGELQAYDGMVRELTKTVEDMQAAQSVPEGFVMVPVELLQLIQCDVENSADWLSGATSALRNLLSAAPEPKK